MEEGRCSLGLLASSDLGERTTGLAAIEAHKRSQKLGDKIHIIIGDHISLCVRVEESEALVDL